MKVTSMEESSKIDFFPFHELSATTFGGGSPNN